MCLNGVAAEEPFGRRATDMPLKQLSDVIAQGVGKPLKAVLDRLMCGLGLGPCPEDDLATNKIAFTVAVVALSAKIAKADGIVTQAETEAFREVFRSSPVDSASVQRVFDLAKQDTAGFEKYATQINGLLGSHHQLKRDVFEGLFNIAAADGILHAEEERYLRRIAEIFGYSDATYRSIRGQFVHDPGDAYTVLGVDPRIGDTELRAHYRKLVRDNHPDALIARGVPPEFIDMATRKLAAINAAYEQVAAERGL